MERVRLTRGLRVVGVAVVGLLCAEAALPFVTTSGTTAEVTQGGSPDEWKVRNRNYKTMDFMMSQAAGTGMDAGQIGDFGGTIKTVTSVDLVLAGTNISVGYNFVPSQNTAQAFNATTPGNWSGFVAQSPGTAVDILVDLVFVITTAPGATFAQVKDELLAGHVGTDEANPDGTLTGNALTITTPTVVFGGGTHAQNVIITTPNTNGVGPGPMAVVGAPTLGLCGTVTYTFSCAVGPGTPADCSTLALFRIGFLQVPPTPTKWGGVGVPLAGPAGVTIVLSASHGCNPAITTPVLCVPSDPAFAGAPYSLQGLCGSFPPPGYVTNYVEGQIDF